MRRPARSVTLDDIFSGILLNEDDPELITLVIKVHLALEAMLIELHQTKSSDKLEFLRLNFPHKTRRLVKMDLLAMEDKRAFDRINDFRNDVAHVWGHRVDFERVGLLARALAGDGVDFDNDLGDLSDEDIYEFNVAPFNVFEKIGVGVLLHAAVILADADGRDLFAVAPGDEAPPK